MRIYTFLGILALILWSSTFAVAKSISDSFGMYKGAGISYLLAGLISLLIEKKILKQTLKSNYKSIVICGVFFVINIVSMYSVINISETNLELQQITLINYLWPILIIIFSIYILKTKTSFLIIPGFLFALAGIILALFSDILIGVEQIMNTFSSKPILLLMALVPAISWALYTNFTKLYSLKEVPVSLYLICSGSFLLILSLIYPYESQYNLKNILEVFFLALAMGASYLFWDLGIRKGNFIYISIISYFTPFFAILISALYLGAPLTQSHLIACVFLILGAYLSKVSLKS